MASGNQSVVRVRVPKEVLYDLRKITSIRDTVLGELGCKACCSGHDIIFDVERNFTVNKELQVRPG